MVKQGAQDADTSAVSKHLEQLGHVIKNFFVRHLRAGTGDHVLVCFQLCAAALRDRRRFVFHVEILFS